MQAPSLGSPFVAEPCANAPTPSDASATRRLLVVLAQLKSLQYSPQLATLLDMLQCVPTKAPDALSESEVFATVEWLLARPEYLLSSRRQATVLSETVAVC